MPAESPVRDRHDGFELIETFRREADGTFLRLDRHLARLKSSAGALGFAFNLRGIEHELDRLHGRKGALRVRLQFSRDGTAVVTTEPFQPLAEGTVWTLRIAPVTRLDAGDTLLRHKTTRRSVYDHARAEYRKADADEVVLLNGSGEACEGTITTLFADLGDGRPLATPPLSCGLLAGVLRAEMLENGAAREAVLTPPDLAAARALLVGNSLRGLIPARLAP
jgi:4-amino-4-deoxychorismate lyase